jgi:DNA-binding transcriptional MocR family regulator
MVNFSTIAQQMRSSEIRRLMKLAADPSVISFAGGMPNNALFPVDTLDQLYASLSTEQKQAAFQYGPTSGYPPLLESLKTYLASRKLPVGDNVLIVTSGGQQAISLLSKVLLDPGDVVITEQPSFIGALAAFKSYGAELHGVPIDADGIVLDALEGVLTKQAGARLKMMYLNPSFHNPAGILYSMERRRGLLELLRTHDVCLLEDDPYSELYFDEADVPATVPIKALGSEPVPIAYVGSFAKIFGPGMRLGWMLAPPDIMEKVELAKQSMDACSATFTQVLAHAYLSEGKLPGYLATVRKAYARRASLMLEALGAHMPDGVTWTTPRGGFYIWVTLPDHVDSSDVFAKSLEQGAAFVVGSAFDPEGQRNNTFRLAFSHTPEERIAEGTEMVCRAVRACL